jgi:hypothetical protein
MQQREITDACTHRWLSANISNGFEVVMVNTAPLQEARGKVRTA